MREKDDDYVDESVYNHPPIFMVLHRFRRGWTGIVEGNCRSCEQGRVATDGVSSPIFYFCLVRLIFPVVDRMTRVYEKDGEEEA